MSTVTLSQLHANLKESIDAGKGNDLVMYQIIEREHLEENANETIPVEKWNEFANQMQDQFADEISALAEFYWSKH